MVQLDTVASHQSPLSVILLFVVFVGFSDGIAQGAIFGDVALLPPKYTQVSLPTAANLLSSCSHATFTSSSLDRTIMHMLLDTESACVCSLQPSGQVLLRSPDQTMASHYNTQQNLHRWQRYYVDCSHFQG